MSRTIAQIQQSMLDAVAADPVLSVSFTSTSTMALWRLIIYIVAVAIWTLDQLMDIFQTDINNEIAALKPHSLQWYAGMAVKFQYGYDLVFEADYYDNTGIADNLIAASLIINYAAVVELTRGIRIKVATLITGNLAALNDDQLTSFGEYMKEVKDAGVKLDITTGPADSLLLAIRIIYNPLVINSTGGRIDGTTPTPIPDAINNHLLNLPFNGVFSVAALEDAIQAVQGVTDLSIDQVQTKYGLLNYTTVDISVIPDAGYLRIGNAGADLTITYIPQP